MSKVTSIVTVRLTSVDNMPEGKIDGFVEFVNSDAGKRAYEKQLQESLNLDGINVIDAQVFVTDEED